MKKLTEYITSRFDVDLITETMSDIMTAYAFILGSIFGAIFLGFVWMVVMKMCAACITWTTIITA